jgi:predicted amidohydrolase YtcJ
VFDEGCAVAGDLIITASSVITMDPAAPFAEAVAVDTAAGTITAVGSVARCRAAAPGAGERHLGDAVLVPGFIDAHSHPFLSGVITQPPAYWIAPYVGFPAWDDVATLFRRLQETESPGRTLIFNGLDRLLQQVAEPDNTLLDGFFPDRPVAVFDNSGHEVYFNSATIDFLGWSAAAPADPEGAHFGRNQDGTSNGRAYETAGVLAVAAPLMASAIGHPLFSAAQWYALMATGGITATSDMTYSTPYLVGYEALAAVPDCPLRISLYHMSIEADADQPLSCALPDTMIRKQGIKLWADGSPWVGTAALSYPYLDSETVRGAGIPVGPSSASAMNYSRAQLDASLDRFVSSGWQMAFHVNGDVGLDIVLDAYQRALQVHGLAGTDHRWRVEHIGGARADQFPRIAALGVFASLGPFQFIYWGDLLDGELFPTEIGAEWMRFADAVNAGVCVSFHNDGSVSPPTPLLNIQAAITRRTPSGAVHGQDQAISLTAALAAHTIDAARTLHREHEIGSISPGKLADFVELSMNPYDAEPTKFYDQVTVGGTWRGGRRIDLAAFLAEVKAIDPAAHAHLAKPAQHCH